MLWLSSVARRILYPLWTAVCDTSHFPTLPFNVFNLLVLLLILNGIWPLDKSTHWPHKTVWKSETPSDSLHHLVSPKFPWFWVFLSFSSYFAASSGPLQLVWLNWACLWKLRLRAHPPSSSLLTSNIYIILIPIVLFNFSCFPDFWPSDLVGFTTQQCD